MVKQYNYKGKTVYVGIDVHKSTYSCVAICEGVVVKKDRMPADPKILVAYLQKHYEGAKLTTAYEAGFSGYHLHRHLMSHGINNKVIHPGSLEVASRDKTKTDSRDAFKIASHISQRRIESIHIPSLDQESERNVTRLRRALTRTQRQIGNRIKSLLHTRGLIPLADKTKVSKRWLNKMEDTIKAANYHNDFIYTFITYKAAWFSLSSTLAEINKRLAIKVNHDDGLRSIYKSAPGIGTIHANEIADELGDMKQFKNEKSLFSFLGLTPSEHSSGDYVRRGHISRQGRSILRAIFIEAAWVAIKKDNSLNIVYQRIMQRRGSKRAIVAVARRLAGRLRSCVLSGCLYNSKRITAEAG